MACPSSMASERKPPELTPSTTFDNISSSFITPWCRPPGIIGAVVTHKKNRHHIRTVTSQLVAVALLPKP